MIAQGEDWLIRSQLRVFRPSRGICNVFPTRLKLCLPAPVFPKRGGSLYARFPLRVNLILTLTQLFFYSQKQAWELAALSTFLAL